MSVSNILHFDFLILLIELIGSLILIRYVIAAIIVLIGGYRHLEHAQYLIADGALIALNFKLAGTLLKTIELKSWQQIFTFSMILLLRTLLKRLFTWEAKQIHTKQLFTKGWQQD
jgi:uncharacterized membrane protein